MQLGNTLVRTHSTLKATPVTAVHSLITQIGIGPCDSAVYCPLFSLAGSAKHFAVVAHLAAGYTDSGVCCCSQ